MVRRLLMRYGYPPDKREDAVRLVLEQAEAMANEAIGVGRYGAGPRTNV
jgi:hypothetical protein